MLETRWPQRCVRVARTVGCGLCAIAAVTFAAFWVRSYYWSDTLISHGKNGLAEAVSWQGRVGVVITPIEIGLFPSTGLRCVSADLVVRHIDAAGSYFSGGIWEQRHFELSLTRRHSIVAAPHWLLLMLASTTAFALKYPPRFRISLRDWMIFLSLCAVVFGAVSSLQRWG